MIANEIEVIIGSALEHLDLVQTITDFVTNSMGFDEDSSNRVEISVCEAVINAIQHGNRFDQSKKVGVRYKVTTDRLAISVVDQGNGFLIDDLPNSLDPENLLKPSGRGIFYMRSFMDEIQFRKLNPRGMEVNMVKKVSNQGE